MMCKSYKAPLKAGFCRPPSLITESPRTSREIGVGVTCLMFPGGRRGVRWVVWPKGSCFLCPAFCYAMALCNRIAVVFLERVLSGGGSTSQCIFGALVLVRVPIFVVRRTSNNNRDWNYFNSFRIDVRSPS